MNIFSISARLYALVGLAIAGMIGTGVFAIIQERAALIEERQFMLSSMTESANSMIAYYHELEQSGALSREDAQERAIQAVGSARYQQNEYFFAFDIDHRIVMHPTRPAGQDMTDYVDATGVYLYREFVKNVTQNGGGFMEYSATRPGFDEQFSKLSHVTYFQPWGWGVATGVYMDDLNSMLWSQAAIIGSFMLVAALATLGMAFFVVRGITAPVNALTGVMDRLAAGDNTVEVPAVARKDEIGQMAQAVLVFKEAAIEKLRLEGRSDEERATNEAERSRNEADKARSAEEDHVVMTALAEGLSALAAGDLTHRVTTSFSPKSQKLKDDFNRTAQQLQETMLTITGAIGGMRSGTSEVSQAADDLSRRTEQQAASLEQTAAALDQITATVKTTADGAYRASQVTGEARVGAEKSGAVVREAVQAMAQIEKSSQQISQIIGVIDEIAFQTNLLALNAGVEAARAGEAGKGFAVVASEVRALAQRSAEAAKEIKDLISTSTQQVEQGVDLVGHTGAALEKIVVQVAEITSLVSEIAASAREQSTGLAEVNSAVNQMDQVTQQNAAMVEQSTAASHNLAQEAEELARLVSQFRLGTHAPASAARARVEAVAPRAQPRPQAAPALKMVSSGSGQAATLLAQQPDADGWEEF